jgi:hypothetical protein
MKKVSDLNNQLTKEFYKLNIGREINLIGSSNKREILYNSDYDTESHFGSKNKEDILKKIYQHFKKVFIQAKKNPNVFIVDFKCGEMPDGEPIRWRYEDMMKGSKSGYTFAECLMMRSTIKLDEIYLLNGSFVDITDNYYFNINGHENSPKPSKKEMIDGIKADAKELVKEGNYYKALKRIYLIKPSKKLVDYFNSEIGILNKSRADLDILLVLEDQTFRKPKISDLNGDLQIIKQDLSYTQVDLSKELDKATATNTKRKFTLIKSIRDKLFEIVNKDAKAKFFK